MLNKNFNCIVDGMCRESYTSTKGVDVEGNPEGYINAGALNTLSNASNLSDLSAGNSETGILLYTEEITESIDTFIPPVAEFTSYSVTTTVKSQNTNDVGVSYSRTIMPTQDGLIKSIALISYYTRKACMIGFENLAEPIQLTAGEPHTFTFTIKV